MVYMTVVTVGHPENVNISSCELTDTADVVDVFVVDTLDGSLMLEQGILALFYFKGLFLRGKQISLSFCLPCSACLRVLVMLDGLVIC